MEEKKKKSKIIYWVLIGVFALIFVVSGTIVVDYMLDSYRHQQQMDEIRNLHTRGPEDTSTPGSSGKPSSSADPSVPGSSGSPTIPSGTGGDTTDPTQPSTTVPGSSGTGSTRPPRPTRPPKPTDPTDETKPPWSSVPTKPSIADPVILSEMQGVYDLNHDVVGWVYIDDSNIDYPVLQKKSDPDYYIDRDIFGNYDKRGCIYAEEHCDVFEPSDVVVLHGHHMADGTMFQNIKKYKYAYYFNSHRYVQFDTLYERRTYEVVLVFRTNGEVSDRYPFFPFHTYNDFKDEADFNNFMESIRELALQESGVEVNYGDKLLCLSTCDYNPYPNGRMVLVAKLIED